MIVCSSFFGVPSSIIQSCALCTYLLLVPLLLLYYVPFLSNRAVTLGSTCFLRAYVDPGTPLGRKNKKIFSKFLVLCVRSKQNTQYNDLNKRRKTQNPVASFHNKVNSAFLHTAVKGGHGVFERKQDMVTFAQHCKIIRGSNAFV